MLRGTREVLWRIVALGALGLGAIGVIVPLLPTVPFLILSAFAASKGWPALERRLLEHPQYGPYIQDWRERGQVPRKAKIIATLLMATSLAGLFVAQAPGWLQLSMTVFLVCVATWLWSRPEAR